MKVYILYSPAYAKHGCSDWMVDTQCNGDGNVFPAKAIMALISKCEQQENKIAELEQEVSALNIQISEST